MLSLARAMHDADADADAAYARIKKGKHLLCVVPMIKLINTQHSYTSCTKHGMNIPPSACLSEYC